MDYFQWKENIKKMNRLDSSIQGRTTMLTIKDSVHQSQTDFTFLMKGWIARKLQARGKIDALLCNTINNRVSLAFLNQQLGLDSQDTIPELLSEYRDWLIEGTNIDIEDKPNL